MGADRTVARSYRVIAPAYEVNSRGVGYAVWVEQHGNTYAVHGAYQATNGGWTKERRISQPFAWGRASRGSRVNRTWPWTIAAGPLWSGRRRSAAR